MTRLLETLLACTLVAAAACTDTTGPVDPVWGKQPCEHCHMLLSEPDHAAQMLTRTGERLYFDDIGCLVERLLADPRAARRAWVRAPSGTWHPALRARYSAGHRTPMGYGIAMREGGPLDFRQVQSEVAAMRAARSSR